jgi:GTPase SAR1 family protein
MFKCFCKTEKRKQRTNSKNSNSVTNYSFNSASIDGNPDRCLTKEEMRRQRKDNDKRSKEIDSKLRKESKIFKSTINLLLLGTGESGKSTIIKQMRIIHTSRYTRQERHDKLIDIKSNIRDSILSIIESMERYSLELKDPNLLQKRDFLIENSNLLYNNSKVSTTANSEIENKLWDCIEHLWKDENVKKCAEKGNEYHLIDSAQYFLDKCHLIRKDDYLPSDQDILRCRILTNCIQQLNFTFHNIPFLVFDVGGQRDQRRKWIQCFNRCTAIIFVVDMSSFNMTLREDQMTNRLKESLEGN